MLADVLRRLRADADAGRPATGALRRGLVIRMVRLAGSAGGYRVEAERAWVEPGVNEMVALKQALAGMGLKTVEEGGDVEEIGHLRRKWVQVAAGG